MTQPASEARLEPSGEGRWRLVGDLTFASVPAVWPAVEALLQDGGRAQFSLGGVGRANSAGLVMLLETLDTARRRGCEVSFVDVPVELLDLARMSNCDGLIATTA